jgi:glyoxylase-like metal-dependent hydrolase (beta-lactamase superfamily II)
VWQAYEPAAKCDLTSAALKIGNELLLIDPIPLVASALEELCSAGRPALIVCTNANHARAAGEFRKRFGARILAHRGAKGSLELEADEWIGGESELLGEVKVCEIEGSVAGEIALRYGDIACLGDAVINLPGHGFAVLPDKYAIDAKLLRGSLQNVLRWQFSVLTFAHGLPLTTRAHGCLADLLD